MSNDLIIVNVLDLCFGVIASNPVPSDDGYALYGGISRLLPETHSMEGVGIHPLKGHQIGNRMISLGSQATLTVRTPSASLAHVLVLSLHPALACLSQIKLPTWVCLGAKHVPS
jgi:hypothetical protein